jgi:YggT family protein
MADFDFVPVPLENAGKAEPPPPPTWSVREQPGGREPKIWDPNQVTPAARANRALANIAHRALQVLLTLSSLVGALLVIRILLVAFKASPSAPFVQFVYDHTSAWLAPFHSMFNNADWSGHQVEINTIIALVFYAFVLLFLVKIIEALLTPRRTQR